MRWGLWILIASAQCVTFSSYPVTYKVSCLSRFIGFPPVIGKKLNVLNFLILP